MSLIKRTIVNVRWMTDAEKTKLAWYRPAVVLELDDGSQVYASQDEEGNGPGTLFGESREGEGFYVFPEAEVGHLEIAKP